MKPLWEVGLRRLPFEDHAANHRRIVNLSLSDLVVRGSCEAAGSGGGGDETYSVRMPSAVSTPSGVSQVTLAVSLPGSAHLSFTVGHLIFGGSISI